MRKILEEHIIRLADLNDDGEIDYVDLLELLRIIGNLLLTRYHVKERILPNDTKI